MSVEQLFRAIDSVDLVQQASLGAEQFVCQDGKIKYIGRSVYVQIENETTKKLPDFILGINSLEYLHKWLLPFKWSSAVSAKNSGRLTSFHVVDDLTTSALALSQTETSAYNDVDEIIFRNKIDNDFSFELTQDQWEILCEQLHSVKTKENSPDVTVTCDNGKIVFSCAANVGIVKVTFNSKEKIPREWKCTYSLESFISTGDLMDMDLPVRISFSNNTSKVLSPLMIEYQNGVTLVASPRWI